MAKKGRTPVRKLKVSENLALGALGSGSGVTADFDSVVDDTTFLLSIEASWSRGDGPGDQGPIAFGVAHSDYDLAEIVEWHTATGAWDRGDLIANEIRKRKIRQIGTFAGATPQETLNNGVPMKTPLKFLVSDGQTLQLWAINQDASVLTTGQVINADGQVWAKAAK